MKLFFPSIFLLFFTLSNILDAQNYFSKRIDVAGKINNSCRLLFINDTFYVPVSVYETPFSQVSTSLVKIDKYGSVISALRFKPANCNYYGGQDALLFNKKIYATSSTEWSAQVQQSLYTFGQNCDTIFTRSYGDTIYYNYGNRLLPYLKTKNKLLLFGSTDSSCPPHHSGYYKFVVRVVDTNGVLYQTKLHDVCFYHGLWDADTTITKGSLFSGFTSIYGTGRNYIIKLDSNLNMQWNSISDTTNSIGNSVISLKNGKLLNANTHSVFSGTNSTGSKVTLTKYDINGNVIWKKRYGNTENTYAMKVKECSNGDFILCGSRSYSTVAYGEQFMGWLMRTDSSGNLKWWHNYIPNQPVKDTIAECYLLDVLQMPDGGFAAAGFVSGTNTFSTIEQTWLLRVDGNGCYLTGCVPPAGVKENQKKLNSLIIYPNPANSELNIELLVLNNPNYNLQITNTLGQTLHHIVINKQRSIINISEFPQGIYFVTIKTGSAVLTKKVVIEH